MSEHPTALIADDEPLLRNALTALLAKVWPELRVVACVRNGREAIEAFDAHAPDVCFLDVRMPGVSGIDVARHIGRRAHLVFVTAYDEYAVQAFAAGVLDYLVKPVEEARLAETVRRLRERLRSAEPATNTDALLLEVAEQLAALREDASSARLRWLRAQVGATLRLIAVESIDYLRSDAKYTRIAWRDDAGRPADALVRTPLRELAARLDEATFQQVHRSVVVNLQAIHHVTRNENETADIHLKGRPETLPVSRRYLHVFRQM
jgi:DNA-binding LytR/AlgR family response regulator